MWPTTRISAPHSPLSHLLPRQRRAPSSAGVLHFEHEPPPSYQLSRLASQLSNPMAVAQQHHRRVSQLNLNYPPPLFIPNLLKPTLKANTILPACPTRQPRHTFAYIPCPPLSTRRVPNAVLSRNPPASDVRAASSHPVSFQPASLPLLDPLTNPLSNHLTALASQPRAGRRHSEEARRKIGEANRGNIPWNKGRRHSEETRRKIAENTRRAMMRPEMRQKLQARARGRKHSEATKLKIRHTSRLVRGARGNISKRKGKKQPLPFVFDKEVVKALNANVKEQIHSRFARDSDSGSKFLTQKKRVMSDETRAKLSRRIKEMWDDPKYRDRVTQGVKKRNSRVSQQRAAEKGELFEGDDDQSISARGQTDSHSTLSSIEPEATATKRARSRRRKSTESTATMMDEILLEEDYVPKKNDIVLGVEDLHGWTKEDLGIVGMHGEGRIDPFSVQMNDVLASRVTTSTRATGPALATIKQSERLRKITSTFSETEVLQKVPAPTSGLLIDTRKDGEGEAPLNALNSFVDPTGKEPFLASEERPSFNVREIDFGALDIPDNNVTSGEALPLVSDNNITCNSFSEDDKPDDLFSPLDDNSFDFAPSKQVVLDGITRDENNSSIDRYVDEEFTLLDNL